MTAKPDETEPRNSPLVGGTLKSRPANPLPFGLGVLCCPIEQLSHPSRVIGLLDTACCWKGDFLAFWCGKVGVLVGWDQL